MKVIIIIIIIIIQLKPWSARGASHHLAFLGNWPTTIHMYLALSTQWMSSSSRKWVSPRYHLVVFVFGVNQENGGIISGGKLLHRPSG